MTQQYTVWAKSPSLNQELRMFDLTGGQNNIFETDIAAGQAAASFAQRLRDQQHMHTQDWEAWVKIEHVGVTTLDNYLFHTGTAT